MAKAVADSSSAILAVVPAERRRSRRTARRRRVTADTAASRLAVAEALFRDFRALTPYSFRPFVKSFDSFDEYETWRRAQTNPWYR
jgi:hypothetical protein